ncbi:fluoride efflux transporter CrcB [Jannaschia aquimarina]|uniref:Fluoride-specific ion channel FluC n=1 Tax=Jannaschia aquimarina TaxID=935700 RepID=A0A0D1D2P5_9RHOB|nr:fluoride efflux transporter CrcB [Jannaschia aquimarina]KIT14343.1 putative fluoride ion transporter CrcB [Jannaschia aquimarina]SNS86588.1 camphor resistance protein CrcB [Jannaschia aquimarina]
MFPQILHVALGGAIGAALRYAMSTALARPGFPVAVLSANVIGSFLMGVVAFWLVQRGLTTWQPFVAAGVLGGFTTFSAFSLEAYVLWERGEGAQAALYIALSVVLSLVALALGVWIARSWLA